MLSISSITINYSDVTDGFCIAFGDAGLVPLYIGFIDKLKDCSADHRQFVVGLTFSFNCHIKQNQVITLANQNKPKQTRYPIKTWNKYI